MFYSIHWNTIPNSLVFIQKINVLKKHTLSFTHKYYYQRISLIYNPVQCLNNTICRVQCKIWAWIFLLLRFKRTKVCGNEFVKLCSVHSLFQYFFFCHFKDVFDFLENSSSRAKLNGVQVCLQLHCTWHMTHVCCVLFVCVHLSASLKFMWHYVLFLVHTLISVCMCNVHCVHPEVSILHMVFTFFFLSFFLSILLYILRLKWDKKLWYSFIWRGTKWKWLNKEKNHMWLELQWKKMYFRSFHCCLEYSMWFRKWIISALVCIYYRKRW